MCVSEESDLIDNTKIANYKLFKYTINCDNCEATLGIAAGGGNAQPLGFIGASYTRRVCPPRRPRRDFFSRPACAPGRPVPPVVPDGAFLPDRIVLPDGPVPPVVPDGCVLPVLPDGLVLPVLPVLSVRTGGGHQGGAHR